MDGFDVVDAHTHVHPTAADAAELRGSLSRSSPSLPGDLDDARATMERLGIRKLVLLPLVHARRLYELGREAGRDDAELRGEIAERWSAYNSWAAHAARAEPDRLLASVAVDPVLLGEEWAQAEIERCVAAGARGLKVMPAWIGCAPDDPRMRVVWEAAD